MDLYREVGQHTKVSRTTTQECPEEIRVASLGDFLEISIGVYNFEG
jgi:hypothetical protein